MVVTAGWLVTDGPEGRVHGNDMFFVPPLERGVLKVQGRAYHLGTVFPQGTPRETVHRDMVEGNTRLGLQQGVGALHIVCGERDPEGRIHTLFGSGKDGLVSCGLMDILSETSPETHEIKFSFGCLKEGGAVVDLLKNILNSSSTPVVAVSGEPDYLGARYFAVAKLSDFSTVMAKVLRSPSFIKHNAGLSLLVSISVRLRSATRETVFSYLDLAPCHLAAHNVLDNIERWRRLNAPDPGVPAFLTFPIRTSGRVSVLACHPSGTILPNTTWLLQMMSQFGDTQHNNTSKLGSPTNHLKHLSPPSGIQPAPAGRASPSPYLEERSASPTHADGIIAKLRKQLQQSDAEVSRHKQIVTEYENRLYDLESAQGRRGQQPGAGGDDGASPHTSGTIDALQRDLAAAEAANAVLEKQLFEKARDLDERGISEKGTLLRRMQDAENEREDLRKALGDERGELDDMQRRLNQKDIECKSRDIEVERLKARFRDMQAKSDRVVEKEVALRDLEADLHYERERIESEMGNRLKLREVHIQRQFDLQIQSEQSAHKRTIQDLEGTVAALQQQVEHANSEGAHEISHIQSKLKHQTEMAEQRSAELARLRAQVPELRRDEANQVAQEYESRIEQQFRAFEDEKQHLKGQLADLSARLENESKEQMVQYDTALSEMEEKVGQYKTTMEQLQQDRDALEERHKAEHDSLVEILQAERAQAEEERLKHIEENAAREAELTAETSRMRNEVAISQAEALKATRVYEAKELELQGLQVLAREADEVRVRNAELERLLRESQHYGKMQQGRRDLEVAVDVLECLRARLVPSWCADWARLGRVKDLKEHLVTRAEELSLKVRAAETTEREQRSREAALVAEHEQNVHRIAEEANRTSVMEERGMEMEVTLAQLRSECAKSGQDVAGLRRIVESVGNLILLNELPHAHGNPGALEDATAGISPLGENWTPSVELEVWLTDTTRQIVVERNTFRDSDIDKTHSIQELTLRCSQLQAENDIVNANVKDMTSQIIGASAGSSFDVTAPITSGDSREYITMGTMGERERDPVLSSLYGAVPAADAASLPLSSGVAADAVSLPLPTKVGFGAGLGLSGEGGGGGGGGGGVQEASVAGVMQPAPTVPATLPVRPVVMMSPSAGFIPGAMSPVAGVGGAGSMPLRDRGASLVLNRPTAVPPVPLYPRASLPTPVAARGATAGFLSPSKPTIPVPI